MSVIQGGLCFKPFELLYREVISSPGAEFEVVKLRFSCPSKFGLSQPQTHVKCRYPTSWLPRARTFSIVSDADAEYFEIAVKVRPGGKVSPFLASLSVGQTAHFAKTLTKRLNAPLDGPAARGQRLAMVLFGIGSSEGILTAQRAVRAGQIVHCIFAVRTASDLVFLSEFCAIARESSGPPAAGSAAGGAARGTFSLHIMLSREEPPGSLQRTLDDLLPTPEQRRSVQVTKGRVNHESMRASFPGGAAEWSHAAALAVGSREQVLDAYSLLQSDVGISSKLLGGPIFSWSCCC